MRTLTELIGRFPARTGVPPATAAPDPSRRSHDRPRPRPSSQALPDHPEEDSATAAGTAHTHHKTRHSPALIHPSAGDVGDRCPARPIFRITATLSALL